MTDTSATNSQLTCDDDQHKVTAVEVNDDKETGAASGGDASVKHTSNVTTSNENVEGQMEDEDDDEDFPKFGDTPRGRIAGPVAGQKPAGNRPR
ncbi:hypothetical protein D9619_008042 [Psilocybe cf. subviscida]|uniref:Uncharacterized protein n=1 Tax=Psilocybe cf. subviscida TaxID=2480587 RepID=A0A8H5ATU7_9AGAR|nr:hypothetical protein D9619_008042 [Psilocybe cf. subviscida]